MNRLHRWYCRLGHWKRKIRDEILPWTLRDIELRDSVLEIGPGPGVTTDWLRNRAKNFECLEIDPRLRVLLGIAYSIGISMCNMETLPQCRIVIVRFPQLSPSQCFTTYPQAHQDPVT